MTSARGRVRALGSQWTPAGRRWRRLLDSFTLDPDKLGQPIPGPPSGDFIICGSPRTGTTLVCAQLWQPPQVVTVMEPWDGLRLPPAELFASLRAELAETGRLSRGKLDIDALLKKGAVAWVQEGNAYPTPGLRHDYLLGVKWPAFWRYLSLLPTTRFLVCLRHPYEVVGSYARSSRALADGGDYDVPFNRAMNQSVRASASDPAVRRVALYDYIHERVAAHLDRPNVLAVRYERWFSEPKALQSEIAAFLQVPLGDGPVRLRSATGSTTQPQAERELISRHCTTAERLGYVLD